MLNHPCIPGINPLVEMYNVIAILWIQFVSIWLRIFASVFVRDIGL